MSVRRVARASLASILASMYRELDSTSILCLHSVVPQGAGFITDSTEVLERVARYVTERSYSSIFASELPHYAGKPSVCFTFDDGYADTLQNAFPILKRYGIKMTIFLITDRIGGSFSDSRGTSRALLTESQIAELLESGFVEFMPHSHTHPDLDALSPDRQRAEIMTSKSIVERITQREANVFAHPRGRFNEATIEILNETGFQRAVGTRPGLATSSEPRFDLPRNFLGDISDAEIRMKLSNAAAPYAKLTSLV